MAEFYSARGWEIPPLPWTNLSPPFSVLKRTMKRYGRPGTIVTYRLRSYGAAIREIGILER